MEIINAFLAAGAILFSWYTYNKHEKRIKAQEEKLNQYQLERIDSERVEAKRAIVEANVVRGIHGKRTIKVYNRGKATAKNVTITFPQKGEFEVLSDPSPIDIKPQHSVEIFVLVYTGSPEKVLINFKWRDEFQEKNSESQTIQL